MDHNNVVLNVYELIVPNDEQHGRAASFFSRFLTPMGFGSYHTSLTVKGYEYSFAGGAGIIKTKASSSTPSTTAGVPSNARFKETIVLGTCCFSTQGEINQIIHKLGESSFTPQSYHLIHRNCNHFTETFATALVLADQFMASSNHPKRLSTYPQWVNRLAKTTGSSAPLVLCNEDAEKLDVCNPIQEAIKAVGADEKVGWDLSSSAAANTKKSSSKAKSSTQKRELTPAQKAALAKVKGIKS